MTAPLSVLLTLSMITPAGPASQTAAPAPQTLEPVLVTSVDTRSGGTGARLLLGDGDGREDIVCRK
jgi:hypothetical protein